jgi:hypothetical protein
MTRDEFVRLVQHSLVSYRDGGVAQMAAQDALLAAWDAQTAEVRQLLRLSDDEIARRETAEAERDGESFRADALNEALQEMERRALAAEQEVMALRSDVGVRDMEVERITKQAEQEVAALRVKIAGVARERDTAMDSLAEAVGALRAVKTVLDDGRLSSHRMLNQIDNLVYAALAAKETK